MRPIGVNTAMRIRWGRREGCKITAKASANVELEHMDCQDTCSRVEKQRMY